MLHRTFDLRQPFRVAAYLRMSSEKQNERSPDQQLDEIKRRIQLQNLPWNITATFRDDGLSGRYERKRPEFSKMMNQIATRQLKVDIILVDTIERLGRLENLPELRRELYQQHGVLVLTADNNFADPTTAMGRVMGMFESLRATEDTRIKAHNVHRGKRDVVQLKRWAGGPVPFGYMLQSVLKEINGRQDVDHHLLVPNPETAWIRRLIIEKAAATGWGQTKLAKWANSNADIPEKYRDFRASTIGRWLDDPICVGIYQWNVHGTDVIDDARVIERNPEELILRIEGYCEPIVDVAVFERVMLVREARRQALAAAKARKEPGEAKLLQPTAPGLTLRYMLTGLVRCDDCDAAMTPNGSAEYVTKDGKSRRYVAYVCPRHLEGSCPNGKRISEEWLREVVIRKLRDRLFPPAA